MLLQLDGTQYGLDLGRRGGVVRWDLAGLVDEAHRVDGVRLGHVRFVGCLEVVLHFVRPGELLVAHRTGEDLPLGTLVVQEGVPLEAVFVLEGFLDVLLGTLHTLVYSVADAGISEEVQTSDGHLG